MECTPPAGMAVTAPFAFARDEESERNKEEPLRESLCLLSQFGTPIIRSIPLVRLLPVMLSDTNPCVVGVYVSTGSVQ